MPRVDLRPPTSRPFLKILIAIRTLPTVNDPGSHVVGKMTSVPFVIKRELLDSPVPSVELLQFKPDVPLTTAPRTRDSRHATLRRVCR
jgi:hypothetical protein